MWAFFPETEDQHDSQYSGNGHSEECQEERIHIKYGDALRQISTAGDIESHLRYQPHAGRFSEREIIAEHLSGRGVKPTADNVVIVNGAQHGLTVTAMGLLRPGDVVAVDALTYPGFKVLAELFHLELIAIPSLTNGPDFTVLRQLCQKRHIRAVYAMPTLHNPMGWVLTHRQRKDLAALPVNMTY